MKGLIVWLSWIDDCLIAGQVWNWPRNRWSSVSTETMWVNWMKMRDSKLIRLTPISYYLLNLSCCRALNMNSSAKRERCRSLPKP